ncbi:MAG: NUDIX hydrolase [Spirochaetaceae bacterium]|jgi:8-oxo-dGTP pyrophosphatase MutT (NUDIX family)|nr:NUDIX hydrolase [Spirochaetaceae bacterium]
MNDQDLIWKEYSRKSCFNTKIFSVSEIESRSPKGEIRVFSAIESNDWAIVIPVIETEHGKEFVMVKQWRHGLGELSIEFPGGVIEQGESIADGARRELREETSYDTKNIKLLASMSPNPAIMSNRVHFFLATDLQPCGGQELDKDEFIEILTQPVEYIIKNMGSPPYLHALMAAALCCYTKNCDRVF